jgi:hypothetical protein
VDSGLQNLLDEMLQDPSWRDPDQLARRLAWQEQLESRLFHAGDRLSASARHRCEALLEELEAINARLYRSLREAIRRGEGASPLLHWAAVLPRQDDEERYGPLDALIGGVLDLAEPAQDRGLEPEMVFYQPTPASQIFDFMARASIGVDDVVFDLGAGLGHVTLLSAICTPARCVGIERQAAYVASAQACAKSLRLPYAEFIEQDVRHADLSQGTVFYLYTPFTGGLLREVLDVLKDEAGRRRIRLCSLGPCTEVVAGEPWLATRDAWDRQHVAVFQSR